jgi:uncharacterized membrane protein
MQIVGKFLLYFLSYGVAGYALFAYVVLPLGELVSPDMKLNFNTNSTIIYTHIFASILALVIGPFQLNSNFRTKHKVLHRWMGRIYLLVGVLVGGLSGLYMSQFAAGGIVARLGFGLLAILWIYSGIRAFLSIRQGNITEHKKWMIRNFSLSFAAVTLRLYLPLSMVSGVEFTIAYAIIAWVCWVPNLIFVEWRYNLVR